MGDHESHVLLQAAADLDIAIDDRERVLRCGGQSAVDTFVRSRNSLSVSAGLIVVYQAALVQLTSVWSSSVFSDGRREPFRAGRPF